VKNFFYIFLFTPFLSFGQQVRFKTIEHYYETKYRFEKYEIENKIECKKDNGETYYALWGKECDSFFNRGKANYLSGEITSLDKRDVQGFADFVSNRMIDYYVQYSKDFNLFDNNLRVSIHCRDINIEFVSGDTGRMIAKAHSPSMGDNTIIVNVDKWEDLNNFQRVWLIMHEWGHESFGMKHGDNKLMYPLMPMEELLKDAEIDDEILKKIEDRALEEALDMGWSYEKAKRKAINAVNKYIGDVWDEEKEEFGGGINRNYTSFVMVDDSYVSVALNTFFDAAVDFFDYLVQEYDFYEYEYEIEINNLVDNTLPKAKGRTIRAVRKVVKN
tara:strand:- start:937 stop:1926 length:990 start_codon:yes stop_codon:yes gene_type:complete